MAFGRSDVDQRLERVLDDGLGQALGCVVGAGGAAGCAGGDVDAARRDDNRIAKMIIAHQIGEWRYTLFEGFVIMAGFEQRTGALAIDFVGSQVIANGAGAASALLAQEGDQVGIAVFPRMFLQLDEGNFRLLVLGAFQAEDDARSFGRPVIKQAFVDMTDLFDIESAEAEAARLGLPAEADLQQLKRFEQVQDCAVVDI